MRSVAPSPIEARRARYVLVGLALGTLGAFAAAVATQAPNDRRPTPTASHVGSIEGTLLRCQALGEAALAEAGCRAAWAEHRRRFLAREARP